jgi:outer membrane protein assembly factor BamC
MNFRVIRPALALCCCLGLLAACGLPETLSESAKIDYKSAGKKPVSTLEIPPDLSNPKVEDRFGVPDKPASERTLSGYQRGQTAAAADRPSAQAPRLLPAVDGVRIERQGTQRWLVAKMPPEKLWPVLREFWQENGFLIAIEQPETGIVETDWAENRAKLPQDAIRNVLGKVLDGLYSTSERDKFRTRLERTAEGTEVFISHRGMIEVYSNATLRDSTRWQARPADPELEAEFLRRLMVRLSVDQDKAREQVARAAVTPAPATPEKARLINDGASAKVEIAEGFDRAWRLVGLSLDRGGFTVEDRDRSQGVYFVRYVDPEVDVNSTTKPGFFARMFSSDKATSARQYRVKLNGADKTTDVSVLNRDGQPLSAEADRRTAGKMLALLYEQLRF